MLEEADTDVLILLDCCAAASSSADTGNGVTELIAACGFETWAPGVSQHSFTRSLIDELKYWSKSALSAAVLHNKVLSRIKYYKPRFGSGSDHERRKTPIHIELSNRRKHISIELSRIRDCQDRESYKSSTQANAANASSQVFSSQGFTSPRILLSLALEDQCLSSNDWLEWLMQIPANVKHARIEGFDEQNTNMTLIARQKTMWDFFPGDSSTKHASFIRALAFLQKRDPDRGYVKTFVDMVLSLSEEEQSLILQGLGHGRWMMPLLLREFERHSSIFLTESRFDESYVDPGGSFFSTFFVVERELGRGATGVVLLVTHVIDGVELGQFACKRCPTGNETEDWTCLEDANARFLSHESIVRHHYVWLEHYKISRFGPSVPCVFFLQQFCNASSLDRYILEPEGSKSGHFSRHFEDPAIQSRRLSLEEIISLFTDINTGLDYLHSNNFIHGDLKPSKCLLHNSGQRLRVVVNTFGTYRSKVSAGTRLNGSLDSIFFCSPEVLLGQEITQKSDIYSMGLILYFVVFARLPFAHADINGQDYEDEDALKAEILAWEGLRDEKKERSDLPPQLFAYMERLLYRDPVARPTTKDMSHEAACFSSLKNQKDGADNARRDEKVKTNRSKKDFPNELGSTTAKSETKSAKAFNATAGTDYRPTAGLSWQKPALSYEFLTSSTCAMLVVLISRLMELASTL